MARFKLSQRFDENIGHWIEIYKNGFLLHKSSTYEPSKEGNENILRSVLRNIDDLGDRDAIIGIAKYTNFIGHDFS